MGSTNTNDREYVRANDALGSVGLHASHGTVADRVDVLVAEVKRLRSAAGDAATQNQRVGQRAFNALHDLLPDVADDIRATGADPFHDDARIIIFVGELAARITFLRSVVNDLGALLDRAGVPRTGIGRAPDPNRFDPATADAELAREATPLERVEMLVQEVKRLGWMPLQLRLQLDEIGVPDTDPSSGRPLVAFDRVDALAREVKTLRQEMAGASKALADAGIGETPAIPGALERGIRLISHNVGDLKENLRRERVDALGREVAQLRGETEALQAVGAARDAVDDEIASWESDIQAVLDADTDANERAEDGTLVRDLSWRQRIERLKVENANLRQRVATLGDAIVDANRAAMDARACLESREDVALERLAEAGVDARTSLKGIAALVEDRDRLRAQCAELRDTQRALVKLALRES